MINNNGTFQEYSLNDEKTLEHLYNLGVTARQEGRSGGPAQDKSFMQILSSLHPELGESIPLLKAFNSGWESEHQKLTDERLSMSLTRGSWINRMYSRFLDIEKLEDDISCSYCTNNAKVLALTKLGWKQPVCNLHLVRFGEQET